MPAPYEQAVDMTHHGFIKIFNEVTRLKISQESKFKDALSTRYKKLFIITLVDKIKSEINMHIPQPIPVDVWQQSGTRLNLANELIYIDLIKILKGLPVTFRLVFNLHVIDGFSHAEIAKMLGITVKDSKYNLFEARTLFKKKFHKI